MSIRKIIIQYLEQYEIYFKFKYSKLVYGFIKKWNPHLDKNLKSEAKLFKSILKDMPKDALIFDIGASVGNTTATFLSLGTKVIAIEPDPKNLHCLRSRFRKNRSVEIIPKAVSHQSGNTELYIQENGNTLHTLSSKWKTYLESKENDRWKNPVQFLKKINIETTTLDVLIAQHGVPYFIKIDVEGFEVQVIKSLKQKIPLIIFEANIPEFLSETLNAIDHLSQIDNKATFNYATSEKVMLDDFVNPESIIDILRTSKLRYLDIICQMS